MVTETIQNPSAKILKQIGKLGWESLPYDLLVKIFSKLEIDDLAFGSSFACRQWYSASLDSSLYKVLDLEGPMRTANGMRLGALLKVVLPRGCGVVGRVRLPITLEDDDLRLVSDRCPNIKFFALRWPSPLSSKAVCYAISKWKDLEGMEVHGFHLSWKVLDKIRSSCKNFVSLKVVEQLSENTALDIVNCLPKLKSIDLSNADFEEISLLYILKGFRELESLDITGCGRIGSLYLDEVKSLTAGFKSFKFDKRTFRKKVVAVCSQCGAEDCFLFGCSPMLYCPDCGEEDCFNFQCLRTNQNSEEEDDDECEEEDEGWVAGELDG